LLSSGCHSTVPHKGHGEICIRTWAADRRLRIRPSTHDRRGFDILRELMAIVAHHPGQDRMLRPGVIDQEPQLDPRSVEGHGIVEIAPPRSVDITLRAEASRDL